MNIHTAELERSLAAAQAALREATTQATNK
jgi:hypothetical protein